MYHQLVSLWTRRGEDEFEGRRDAVEVVLEMLWKKRNNGNVLDMSWWGWCANASVVLQRGGRGASLCEGPIAEDINDKTTTAGGGIEDNRREKFEKRKLF